jgi:dTDP-4-amino-4,6-dideoxygalactose transaminase
MTDLRSFYKGRKCGTLADISVLSFNGNKIITTGGGGALLSNIEDGVHAKHITTTAKVPHPYLYRHDLVGYNYRMPNLNAALGVAQIKKLDYFVDQKRSLAKIYSDFFSNSSYQFVTEPKGCRSNYWLNAIICETKAERDGLLLATNEVGIKTRPAWALMNSLAMYKNSLCGDLHNSEYLQDRLLNLPSSVPFL